VKLHKKQKAGLILVASLLVMGAVIPLGIWVTHTPSAELGNGRLRCESGTQGHAFHTVVIRNGTVTPSQVAAQKCDTLTILNLDSQKRLITFSSRNVPISYDGVSARTLARNQSLSITLIQTGAFTFHGNTGVMGSFTVT
jgi:hypothetical protein